MSHRIACIRKTNRTSAHERIDRIGGVNTDGTRWTLSQPDAIEGINSGKWKFHVERPPGHTAKVIVSKTAAGHQYLKTEADGEQPNNLLSLPDCP